MSDYPPGYTGSLAASPKREPEKDDGFTLTPWEHWGQQRDKLAWFGEKSMMYLVMGVKKVHPIEVWGKEVELPLKWANGMVGCIPVFDTAESAAEYAGEKQKVVMVREVMDAE
jgi:hypothetical protein